MTDTRSRTGCMMCRQRRRKCDEARPSCGGCVKRNLACDYRVRVRWSSDAVQSGSNKRRRTTAPDHVTHPEPPTNMDATGDPEDRSELATYVARHVEEHMPLLQLALSAGSIDESVEDDASDGCTDFDSESSPGNDSWELVDDLANEIDPSLFARPGEHIAFLYYIKYLSGVLPAMDSSSNPYRRLSKLALVSPVLLNTIISLSTEYMYLNGRAAPDITLHRHGQAFDSLRNALVNASKPSGESPPAFGCSDNEIGSKEATLCSVLLQIANVVFTGGTGVEVHLACAMHFLRDLKYLDAPAEDFLPRLLVQRFAMLDVITAVQRRRRPQLPCDCWFFAPNDFYDKTEPSFREMTGCPQPVLGYLARIANLQAELLEAPTGDYDLLSKASTLETDLRIYARSRVAINSTRSVQASHLDSLSQCFYWSAHLLLQRRIFRDASTSRRVQQTAANIVKLIKSMPLGCGPDSSLLFPFYLSSKEAITEEHRSWVRVRNNEMKKIYSARSRDAVMALLEDIWGVTDDLISQNSALSSEIDSKVSEIESNREICLF